METLMENTPQDQVEQTVDSDQYKKRFKDAIADAQHMMAYAASACPKDIEPDTLKKLINMRHRVENHQEISVQEETDFWLAYQDLWKLVSPATAESIKANLPLERTFASKLFGKIPILSTWLGKGTVSKARKIVDRYIFLAGLVLIPLLILQIYWVIGNQLTSQLAELLQKQSDLSLQVSNNQQEYKIIELRYQQNEKDSGKYDPNQGFTFYSSPEWERDTIENLSTKTQLESDLETLKSQLERGSTILLIWSSPWSGLIDFIEKEAIVGNQIHNDKYAPQFDDLAAQSASIKKQIEEIDKQANADPNGMKTADDLNSGLKSQLESIDAQLANLYSNNNDLAKQAADLQKQVDGINDQLNTLSSTAANAVESLKADLEKQLADLNTQAADTQKQIDGINNQLSATASTDTNTISDLEKQLADLNKQAADTHLQIDGINNQLSALSSDAITVKSDLEKQKAELEQQLTQLAANKALIEGQIQNFLSQRQNLIAQQVSPEQIVNQWNQAKERLNQEQEQLTQNQQALSRQEQADNNREKARQAQLAGKFVLDILQGYLLPLLYGMLGAATYVIRDLSKQIKEVTYSEGTGVQHLSRISLGALAGIMVGWFSFLINTSTFLGSVSPLAIAFLVGYNIELFFSLMDIAINRIKRPQETESESQIEKPEKKLSAAEKAGVVSGKPLESEVQAREKVTDGQNGDHEGK